MPTWAIALSNIVTFIIIIGGALNFPYIPMFFGVYAGSGIVVFENHL